MFTLKRKIIGTNHPLFVFHGCYCLSKTKQNKTGNLNYYSVNEWVLTLVKIVTISPQLFTLASYFTA